MTAIDVKHKIVTREVVTGEEWLKARKALLAEERTFTHQRDELSRKRRKLPWVKVEKQYVFDGPQDPVSLGDLFQNRSQLIVYHFMFGPGWKEGCPSCSFLADHFGGMLVHLADRDVSLAAVSRAPINEIAAFQKRMGWRFPWVSSHGNDFNRDYHVSFTPENRAAGTMYYNYGPFEFPSDEAPGASVFFKDPNGDLFHTYSTYARGLDILLGAYNFLDLVPKGRNEEGMVPHPMAWVRHHDRYVDAPEIKAAASCCAEQEHA
jgi:predicted dithiol-disulfide oxidoreductase (DUF899 family)